MRLEVVGSNPSLILEALGTGYFTRYQRLRLEPLVLLSGYLFKKSVPKGIPNRCLWYFFQQCRHSKDQRTNPHNTQEEEKGIQILVLKKKMTTYPYLISGSRLLPPDLASRTLYQEQSRHKLTRPIGNDNKEIQLSADCHNICAMSYPQVQNVKSWFHTAEASMTLLYDDG